MYSTLFALHTCFCTPLKQAELEQEVNECHRQLIERLEKPERKLALRIIDAQNAIADNISMDSFAHGLKLGLRLSEELRQLETRCDYCCQDNQNTD